MDVNTVLRELYSWVDKCRLETAIDPDPANFELVMHPATWNEVLLSLDPFKSMHLVTASKLNGYAVRTDLDMPLDRVKLRCTWEVTL